MHLHLSILPICFSVEYAVLIIHDSNKSGFGLYIEHIQIHSLLGDYHIRYEFKILNPTLEPRSGLSLAKRNLDLS